MALDPDRGHFAWQTCAVQEGGAIPAGPWTRNQKRSFGVSRYPIENLQGFRVLLQEKTYRLLGSAGGSR